MSLPNTPFLLTKVDGGVLQVSINRADARHAMNEQVLTDLISLFSSLTSRDDLRAVVIRGAGGNSERAKGI